MKKTSKKVNKNVKHTEKNIELALINILTDLCENFKNDVSGFSWLTHVGSLLTSSHLKIMCIFEHEYQLEEAVEKQKSQLMTDDINQALASLTFTLNIKNKVKVTVSFDSEEACEKSHRGDWEKRFKQKLH